MNFKQFYLKEAERPPGFNDPDMFIVQSLDEFIEDEGEADDTNVDDDADMVEEDIDDVTSQDVDIGKVLKTADTHAKYRDEMKRWQAKSPAVRKKLRDLGLEPKDENGKPMFPMFPDENPEGLGPKKMPLHLSTFMGFKDYQGHVISSDEVRKLITTRPKKLIAQNDKLSKSGVNKVFYDLTMPAYKGLWFDTANNKFKVISTCPFAGECKRFCYALKGGYIQYSASALGAAQMLNFLMNDYEGFKTELLKSLAVEVKKNNKKGMRTVLRWHDAGDFMSPSYLRTAFDIAKAMPEVLHYAYTKMIPMVRKMESEKPKNFIFNFSYGGAIDTNAAEADKKVAPVGEEEYYRAIDPKTEKHSIVFDYVKYLDPKEWNIPYEPIMGLRKEGEYRKMLAKSEEAYRQKMEDWNALTPLEKAKKKEPVKAEPSKYEIF